MLKVLSIKDFALIDNININFGKGLNIITGETGAGKSIILDALGLILGDRASVDVIRKGANKTVIEAIFDISGNTKVKKFLVENEIDYDDELIVRREVSIKGTSRCFINDIPTTLNNLKEAGNYLVDLHGQHEHQSLLDVSNHIKMLDEFGNLTDKLKNYHDVYTELNKIIKQRDELKNQEKLLKEKLDFYSFQFQEISNINPQPNEDETLEEELKVLENSEKLLELTSNSYDLLYSSDNSVINLLGLIEKNLIQIVKYDKSKNDYLNLLNIANENLVELSNNLRQYLDIIDLDPQALEEKRNRLVDLNNLKRKYGKSIAEILEYKDKIAKEIDIAENFNDKIAELENNIKNLYNQLFNLASELSKERKEIAQKVEQQVVAILANLGIEKAKFKVEFKNLLDEDITKINYNFYGYDELEFLISTNLGEDLKPLSKVASGGEISRIMLALKTILAKSDKLPILVFDEIDTGISGRIAQKVGEALKDLAKYHQIISITHLPQIAGFADIHFMVKKEESEGRTVSSITKLSDDEHIYEIAKMISGDKVTEAAIESAKTLVKGI
ncbi:MAG TPA: DNA repair protein RecN [Ignavibacteriales bacterium]|nr:DNA repair protein RecN [Ignavibacteriales bacterium]HOL81331.1 DNA repair protein RecN [Ignavibacteriales bacterium]HPP33900.1 DNA repair protein RecN [Ignavibacteriales bacterium]HRT99769.1 DNA repair protein RecN [Ignavibacteriales bacterium]